METYGACINFHYENIKDAKTLTGQYKFPTGRKAYDECVKNVPPTDGMLGNCAMIFHREVQSEAKQKQMCTSSVRDSYLEITKDIYWVDLYDSVWKCEIK